MSSYPPLPPDHVPPGPIRRVSFWSHSPRQNSPNDQNNPADIMDLENPNYRESDSPDRIPSDVEDDLESETAIGTDEDPRMRGGCGGGGSACGYGVARSNCGFDCTPRNPCGSRYQKDRSSTIEGACGCSGRGKSGCASGSSGCCGSGASPTANFSGVTAGCCPTNYDNCHQGACASKPVRRFDCDEVCPPRCPDPCTSQPSSLSACNAGACSPPCSGRKGCCPPAGCRPVKRRVARCDSPCTGDTKSCGGGGCCGGGCRGGCGKPGQTCLPLRPCTIPPCMPHPQGGGGSPCAPPRRCPPQPPCCRQPVVPGIIRPGTGPSILGGGGGSSCCRSSSPGNRNSGGGGGCGMTCQQQDDFPFDSCCQPKVPGGCECLGGGQDCQRCGRKVYQAEMQIASGVPYHNICFSCFCCRKPLETLTYHENCGEIYCKQCYVRNFGPQGYGYSGVLQTPM